MTPLGWLGRKTSAQAHWQISLIFDRVICPWHDNVGILSCHILFLKVVSHQRLWWMALQKVIYMRKIHYYYSNMTWCSKIELAGVPRSLDHTRPSIFWSRSFDMIQSDSSCNCRNNMDFFFYSLTPTVLKHLTISTVDKLKTVRFLIWRLQVRSPAESYQRL